MQMQNDPAVAMPELPPQQDQEELQQQVQEGQAPTQRQAHTISIKTLPTQNAQSAEPTPIKDEEILEAPDEEHTEAPQFAELDSPLPY